MKTRGKVSLCAWSPVDQTRLYQKLALWMPAELFIASVDKFVTNERQEVLATTRVNLVGEWYWEPKDMWKATKVFKEEKGKDMDEEVEREGLVVLSVSNAGASKKRSFFKMNDEDHENLLSSLRGMSGFWRTKRQFRGWGWT